MSMVKKIEITIKDQCSEIKEHAVIQSQKLERLIQTNNHTIKKELWANKKDITQ